jgi:hypothetical protein
MYPLNMKLVDGVGFAVANDEGEHQALTTAGYGPAYVAPAKTSKAKGGASSAPAAIDDASGTTAAAGE